MVARNTVHRFVALLDYRLKLTVALFATGLRYISGEQQEIDIRVTSQGIKQDGLKTIPGIYPVHGFGGVVQQMSVRDLYETQRRCMIA